jgi:thioredoxin 1
MPEEPMKKFRGTYAVYLFAGLLIFIYAFSKQGTRLSPAAFAEKLQAYPAAQIVDVRTPGEFSSGFIKKAVNIDWSGSAFETAIQKLDKDQPVFLYCLGGGRSSYAAKKMASLGFREVYELDGGIMAWKADDMPLAGTANIRKGMTTVEYDTLIADKRLVLVDFYAPWCGPCKKIAPILDEISTSRSATLKVVRINSDKDPAICEVLKVSALPTLVLYKNGKEIWKHNGFISKEDLLKHIDK